MRKFTVVFSCAALWATAVASPLSIFPAKWDANPVVWTFRDGAVECGSHGGFAISLESPRASKVAVSAKIAPASSGTNCWATLGVALVDDERNYWHLAFVQAPPENGGKHFFELAEEHCGRWNAHFDDKLRRELHEDHGSWRFGETYFFKLTADGAGIQGEVRDSAGNLLFLRRYAFPAPDAKGSVAAVTCGRPALHATGRFRGTVSALDAACSDVRPDTAQNRAFPPYASDSFVPGVKEKATGFFRVVQRPDGRWWAIDPLGRGVVLMGVDHVSYNGVWSQRTKRSDYHEANKKKFPDKRDWEADTLKRLKSWGFNMLGAGCETSLERRGLIHTRFLSMGDALCRNEQDDALWICPNEHCPCSAFPNVFDPLFPAYCDYVARHRCAPNRDDPWLFGYFIDNELAWWGRGARDTGLYDAVMKKSETHSAKIALRAFLKERGVTGEPSAKEKLDFLRLAAERYFSCAAAAIRRHDPNHLVLGARFAGVDGAHDAVWEVAGKYCDVVTFNFYPWADLDRNVACLLRRDANAPLATDVFAERYAIAKRPILVTEWSFPALDSGLPCKYGAGQRFRTQKERAAASELFAKTMLATSSVLGYDYFMWVDEPAEGTSDDFPEDSNYGLVNLQGEAYPEITSMFAALQKDAGDWRHAPVPPMRPVSPSSMATASAFARRLPAPSAPDGVAYVRNGDDYTITTRGGLVLSGRVGGSDVFSRVSLKGIDLGSYSTMLYYRADGIQCWANIENVTGVSFVERKGWGVLEVVGENRGHGGRHSFEIAQKIAIHPDKPYFLCDIKKVANIGTEPIDMCDFFFRQHTPYAAERMQAERTVPSLWRDSLRDAWLRASDGVWWGGLSTSPACTAFHYFLSKDGNGTKQHPDASFDLMGVPPADSPKGCWRLKPGTAFDLQGTAWMLCIGGTGGRYGWERQIRELTGETTVVDVGKKLQVMWDDHVVDAERTTATRLLHHPVYAGTAMTWDRPWEGDGSEFPNVVFDTDKDGKRLYRMYYVGWNWSRDVLGSAKIPDSSSYHIQTCYAESRDGINWVRPELGRVEFEGSKKNNILASFETPTWKYNFFVFKDLNPACPPEERYKAVSSGRGSGGHLCVLTSADGINFKPGWKIVKLAPRTVMDDTSLASFWYPRTGEYHVYLRGNRLLKPEEVGKMFVDKEIRQVRHAVFKDLHRIEESRVIDCVTPDGEASVEYPMYTPCAFPYYRNTDIIVSFATRYNQRGKWDANYDLLPDVEHRKMRCTKESRMGLAVTDGLFAVSRDGQRFVRYDEAFMRPGPQRPSSWVYGDCYPGAFVIPTPAADGSGEELSIYRPLGHMMGKPAKLERFTIRMDGFVSRHATFKEQKVVTKMFTFDGSEMLLNFSTSARGRIAVYLYLEGAKNPSLASCWMFGDRVDSPVTFPKGKLTTFAGKPVRLEFVMSDADLYSFRFR